MQHLHALSDAVPDRPTALTVGGFDGVHRGHQQVIERVVKAARTSGRRTAALTFFPLPKQVVRGRLPHYYLATPDERARLLHQHGMELVITMPFDEDVRHIRAADFVDRLVSYLQVKEIWVGPDFALGYQREGNLHYLRAQGKEKGFVVRAADHFLADDVVVSSTVIRQALSEGRVLDAGRYLGRPFHLPGTVVKGDGRGSQLGFPTANLQVWDEHAVPARGVYAAIASFDEVSYPAAVNIGNRPTIGAGDILRIEAHLLDFAGDLYGKALALDFIDRLRDELRFDDLGLLAAQIRQDVADARRVVASHRP